MKSQLEFKSIFAEDMTNLIELKRSLGFKYITEVGGLKRIDNFLVSHNITEKELSREVVEEWCQKRSYESPANRNSRICMMRIFARYLVNCGIKAYIPPKKMTKHGKKYDAHIYTKDEIRRFFAAVDQSKSVNTCPYRALIMPVFFRILYTSGMRVSELRLARVKDVDVENAYICVRNGKNHKDRIVPIRRDLAKCCRKIKEIIHVSSNEEEYFFMQLPGHPMSLRNLYHNFRRYLDKAGIPHTGKGPRIHDFRHTYCINLLKKWIDEGKNLYSYVDYMRTMLGHETFNETAYYLKLTLDLYPSIRDKIESSYPHLIEEVNFNEI